jgi:hypothetical protein
MLRIVGWMSVATIVLAGCEGKHREWRLLAPQALARDASMGAIGTGPQPSADEAQDSDATSAADDFRSEASADEDPCRDDGDAGSCLPIPLCDVDGVVCEATCPGCLIGPTCIAINKVDPDNDCRVCDPERNPRGWSPNDGATCDDGLFCTVDDVCLGEACEGIPRTCEDSVACNGVSMCDEPSDACTPDINGCGNGAFCDVQTGSCVSTCAGCVIEGVCFASGAEASGNPCRVCDPMRSSTAFSPAVGKDCGAGPNACSQQDSCDNAGRCLPNHLPSGTPCGSSVSNICDQPDSCDGSGNCQPHLVQNGTACDDGSFCATGDQCQGGQCVATSSQNCGANRVCNEASNQCQCQGCTIVGNCIASDTINPANSCEICDPGRNANVFSPSLNGRACDDGAFCTVGDQCQGGQCAAAGARSCGDGLRCDEAANACVIAPIPVQLAVWATETAQATVPLPVTSVVQGVAGSNMTAGPGFQRGPDLGSIFASTGWPTDGSVDLSKYVQIGMAPAGLARAISYDHFEFGIGGRGGFGPGSGSSVISIPWQLRSDVDAFQFPIASGTVLLSLNEPTIRIAPSIRTLGTISQPVTFRVYLATTGGLELGLGIVDLMAFGVVQ